MSKVGFFTGKPVHDQFYKPARLASSVGGDRLVDVEVTIDNKKPKSPDAERRWQGATFGGYSGTTDVVFRDGAAQTFGTFRTVVDGREIETAIANGDTYETIQAMVRALAGARPGSAPVRRAPRSGDTWRLAHEYRGVVAGDHCLVDIVAKYAERTSWRTTDNWVVDTKPDGTFSDAWTFVRSAEEKRPKAAVNQVWRLTREVYDLPPGVFRVKELYPNGCALLGEVVPSPRGNFMTTTRDMAVVMPLQDGRLSDAWEYVCTPTVISGMAPVPTLPQIHLPPLPKLPPWFYDEATSALGRVTGAEDNYLLELLEKMRPPSFSKALAAGFDQVVIAMWTPEGQKICKANAKRDLLAARPRVLEKAGWTAACAAYLEGMVVGLDVPAMVVCLCRLLGEESKEAKAYRLAMATPVKTSGKWRYRGKR